MEDLVLKELRDDVTKLDNANIVLRNEVNDLRLKLEQHLIDVA